MNYKRINDYEVLYMVKENDEDARDLMLTKYMPIIRKVSSKYYELFKDNGADFDDFVQEGLIALNKAINSFDEKNDVLFYTYALTCINRHLITFCRNITSKKHMILNGSVREDESIINVLSEENIEKEFENRWYEAEFVDFKNSFDFIESGIFELRYNGFTYKEISQLLDISVRNIDSTLTRIRRILHKKFEKMIY